MELFNFREPISTLTHGIGFLLTIPGLIILWKKSRNYFLCRLSLMIFITSMACCYAGSTLFHGINGTKSELEIYNQIDHAGIFLLIAGTYTPLVCNLMKSRWRWIILFFAWSFSLIGAISCFYIGVMTPFMGTAFYLGLGWGAIVCYIEASNIHTRRRLFLLLLGGFLYSVGALIHLFKWPIFYPGIFGHHELFHLFVMSGSLCHYIFMTNIVIPAVIRQNHNSLISTSSESCSLL